MSIAPYAKSLIAAAVAGLASLQQALDGDNDITASEWVAVAVATLVALGVVFAVPNRDPAAEHQEESVQPPQAGAASLVTIVVIVVAVLLLAWLLQAVL